MMILSIFIFHHFLDFPTILILIISLRSTKQVWAHERQKAKSAVRHTMSGCGQSLNPWRTLTKISASFIHHMDRLRTEYKSLGQGARTPTSPPNPSRFVTTDNVTLPNPTTAEPGQSSEKRLASR